VFTADNVLLIPRQLLKSVWVGALYVSNARYGADGQTIIITKVYATGQFVRRSAYMHKHTTKAGRKWLVMW